MKKVIYLYCIVIYSVLSLFTSLLPQTATVSDFHWFQEENVTVIRGTIEGENWERAIVRDKNNAFISEFSRNECGNINFPCWFNPFNSVQPAWNFGVIDDSNSGDYKIKLLRN